MDSLKGILKQVLKTTPNYDQKMLELRVQEAWPQVVGEKVALHCWPLRFISDQGLLIIAAESSVWLQSLKYLENQILNKYEKRLKSRKVKQLRFRLQTATQSSKG